MNHEFKADLAKPIIKTPPYYREGKNLAKEWKKVSKYEFEDLVTDRNFPHKLKIARKATGASEDMCALCLGLTLSKYKKFEEEHGLLLTSDMQKLLVFHTGFLILWFYGSVPILNDFFYKNEEGLWTGGGSVHFVDYEEEHRINERLKNAIWKTKGFDKKEESKGKEVPILKKKIENKQLKLFDF